MQGSERKALGEIQPSPAFDWWGAGGGALFVGARQWRSLPSPEVAESASSEVR